jgi:hypothetical protein
MHVLVVYKSKSSFLWLVFRKDGVMIKNYRLDTGKESILLSYPDFEEYKAIFFKNRKNKKEQQHPKLKK